MTDPPVVAAPVADHAPIESIYGTACGVCVTWTDAPLAEGGETEFGIAIPAPWPCPASQRIAELAQLAGEVLGSYYKASDGYRGRVGQVQIARWQAVLNGQPADTT